MQILKLHIIILLLLPSFVFAGEYEWVQKFSKSELTSGAVLHLKDPNYVDDNANMRVVSRTYAVSLIYGRENQTDVQSNVWSYKLDYSLNFGGTQPSQTNNTNTGTLRLRMTASDHLYESVQIHKPNGAPNAASLKITALFDSLTNAPDDFRLEIKVTTERYRKLDITNIPAIGYNANTKFVYWDFIPGAEYYELEWNYIDDNSTWPAGEVFHAAVRIATDKTWYEPHLSYREGNVHFRVRAVGRFTHHSSLAPSDYSHKKFGNWSSAHVHSILTADRFEPGHNLQYVTTYAESGKFKKVMSYMDGALNGRQSLTNLSTDGTTVVTQTEYDHEGRGVLTTLPIPIDGINLGYIDLLNQNIGQYARSDFDRYGSAANAMITISGATKYYSSSNGLTDFINKDYVPDAKGFPFTQVEFKRDHTGRVAKQSGVGPDHQLESGRETSIFYGDATSTELHKLFGSNVGNANHYLKKMTVDPNGQVSFAWQDQEERVIATALAGDSPGNLTALPVSFANETVNMNDNNLIDFNNLESRTQHTILNENPSKTYTFTYDLTGVMKYIDCECIGCEYDLEIIVWDPLGNKVNLDMISPGTGTDTAYIKHISDPNPVCDGSYQEATVSFSCDFLSLGEYIVSKVLKVSTSQYSTVAESLKTCPKYPQLHVAPVDSSLCAFTCEEQMRYWYFDQYGSYPNQQWMDQNYGEFCGDAIANSLSDGVKRECDAIYQQMITQFAPGGWLFDATVWANVSVDSMRIDSLVQTHREWCHYRACLDDTSSRIYDAKMAMVATFSEANNSGYNYPVDPNSNLVDPWFDTGGPGVSLRSAMQDITDSTGTGYKQTNSNIWSFYDPHDSGVLSNYYAVCGTTNYSCMDTLRWRYFRGAYLDEKLLQQIYYRENVMSPACPYQQDNNTLVPKPQMPSVAISNPQGWSEGQTQILCNQNCDANVATWMDYIQANCTTALDTTALRIELMDYCLAHCGTANPFGDIFAEHITNGKLNDAIAILDDYSCEDLLDSLAIPDPNVYDVDGQNDTTTYVCTRFDPCFIEMIELINNAQGYNLWPGKTISFSANDVLTHCYAGDTGLDVRSDSTFQFVGGTGSCRPLMFLDGNQVPVGLSTVQKIQFPIYEPGASMPASVILQSNTYDYQKMRVELVISGTNGPTNIDAWVYSQDVCTAFNTFQTDCYTILAPPVDTGLIGLFAYALDLDSLRDSCLAEQLAMNTALAQGLLQDSIDQYLDFWVGNHQNNCLKSPFAENFKYSHLPKVHQFTLYFYDQAGNLIQTVPPEGVDVLDNATALKFDNGTALVSDEPDHALNSKYRFNSLNQVVWQYTPDGGVTEFWYDEKDQLRISRDSKQRNESTMHYSYSRYDELGRVDEVGEVTDLGISPLSSNWQSSLNDLTFPDRASYVLRDITTSIYDDNILWSSPSWQDNLRMRVASVWRERDELDYFARIFYSYDDHGNVKQIRTSIPDLGTIRIDYTYELVSGNVLQVQFQPGKKEYFTHKYCYDADNRITEAWTSKNDVIWARDARYFFYPHGPLSRMEIGQDLVQGCDYYYTIHGWIKGVNVPGSEAGDLDPGSDGLFDVNELNRFAGRDEMAFGLGFYEGEYDPIGTNVDLGGIGDGAWNDFSGEILKKSSGPRGLFNGNIPLMVTEIDPNGQSQMYKPGIQAMAYQYDQLNRIKQSRSSLDWDGTLGWQSVTNEYKTNFGYDKNGNIKSLQRWSYLQNGGSNGTYKIDDLSYNYTYSGGILQDNRLLYVDDNAGTLISDPGDLRTQAAGNYVYDSIGRLVHDNQEGLDAIVWDDYDKVIEVNRAAQSLQNDLDFYYDGMGNRTRKDVITNPASGPSSTTSTFYARDAQGNVLAVYEQFEDGDTLFTKLVEWHIYGSDRIGLCKPDMIVERECIANCSLGSGGGGSEKSVVFQEIFYDSPLTENSNPGMPLQAESHQGEYILLWNSSDQRVNLSGWEVENLENNEVKHLGGSLDAGERLLLANTPTGQEDKFFSITQLPLTIVNDTTFQEVYFTDSLTLWDNGGQMRLKNASGDVVDAVDYGIVYGLDSDNDYVADSLLDSLYLRSSLTAVRRTSISAIELPAGGEFEIDKPDPHINPRPNYGGARFGSSPGSKLYELKNHLGNVLAVVSDMKLGQGTTATADYYLAELMAAQDYYPFGWLQPGRKWNNPSYRYGFQGQEKDDELKGGGASLNYKFRMHDPRVGRFFAVDPLGGTFPWNSTYAFSENDVISAIELEGAEKLKIAHRTFSGSGFPPVLRNATYIQIDLNTKEIYITILLPQIAIGISIDEIGPGFTANSTVGVLQEINNQFDTEAFSPGFWDKVANALSPIVTNLYDKEVAQLIQAKLDNYLLSPVFIEKLNELEGDLEAYGYTKEEVIDKINLMADEVSVNIQKFSIKLLGDSPNEIKKVDSELKEYSGEAFLLHYSSFGSNNAVEIDVLFIDQKEIDCMYIEGKNSSGGETEYNKSTKQN